jgi:hypothetical protein
MSRRMLDDRMWRSRKFKMMPPLARLMQISLINKADDQGRCMAHPDVVRAEAFLYEDVKTEQIQVWLDLMVRNGTIILYQADGEDYLQFLNWWEYQTLTFAKPSQFPAPEGWQDRICINGKANIPLTYNWCKADGSRPSDTCDAIGKPLPFVADRIAARKKAKEIEPVMAKPQAGKEDDEVYTEVYTSVYTQDYPQVNKEEDQLEREGEEEEKRESNSNGAPLPPAPPVSSSRNHPLIIAFHELHNRYPTKAQMAAIIEHDPKPEDWRRAIHAWDMAGHNPTNIQGMLDWAFEPSRYESKQPSSKEQNKSGYSEYNYLLPRREAAP